MRIMVFGEGPHEVGRTWGQELNEDDLAALPQLVHRLLDCPTEAAYVAKDWTSVPHTRLSRREVLDLPRQVRVRTRLGRKVQNAILLAKAGRCAGAAVLIDRDGAENADRIDDLKKGRNGLANSASFPPCAVGVAVEAFDAWMIADETGVNAGLGDSSKCPGSPESEPDPKSTACDIFGVSPTGTGLGPAYERVAGAANLEVIEERCPEGFAPFAAEVRERIGPVVEGAGNKRRGGGQ